MGLNSQSETNPTGQTQTYDSFYDPRARAIQQSQFYNELDYNAVYGGRLPNEPFRPAAYQQNWSGLPQWQTWAAMGSYLTPSEYPTGYRPLIARGNAADTAQLLLLRNQPQQYAPAPIAISQYALATQQVYIGGSDFSGGMYG